MKPPARQLAEIPPASIKLDRAIVIDWQDGPLEGFLRISDIDCSWYFQIIGERTKSDLSDDRIYVLFQASNDSLERLTEVLPTDGPPTGRLWVPIWRFRDSLAQNRAEEVLARVLDEVGQAEVLLRSSNLVDIQNIWSITGHTTISR
jgi:hypothetical protein